MFGLSVREHTKAVGRWGLKVAGRHYPLFSGCSRIANSRLLAWLAAAGHDKVRLRNGAIINIRRDDFDGRALYYFGEQDPKITWICERVLRRGDCMLDIGANWGAFALVGAKLVGAEGTVHAFEPQSELAAALRKSAHDNGFRQLIVHQLGLSLDDGTAQLHVKKHHTGAASLRSPSTSGSAQDTAAENVELRNTSKYLKSLQLGRIRLVKLDAEGHEAAILEGARDFFADRLPDVVIFEHLASEGGDGFWNDRVVQLLGNLGYDFWAVPFRGILTARLRALTRGMTTAAHDYVAIAPGQARADLSSRLSCG